MLSSYSAAAFVAPSSVVVARGSKLDATSIDNDQPVVSLKEIDESQPNRLVVHCLPCQKPFPF